MFCDNLVYYKLEGCISAVMKDIHIGVAINTSVKPSRDFLLSLERVLLDRNSAGESCTLRFFLGSAATCAKNLAKFAASGIDVLLFCGMPRKIIFNYLETDTNHPPIVFCTYSPVSDEEFARLGRCAVVMRDNAAIGRMAADFFIQHGLRNFAFLGRRGYREDIAGVIREDSFRERLVDAFGKDFSYSSLLMGSFVANEDYWEPEQETAASWLCNLPLPCGVFVNGDHLAFRLADGCRRIGFDVPGSIEILSINHNEGFSERAVPAISSITPSSKAIASKALDLALELVANPAAGFDRHVEVVDESVLEERGSTSMVRGYGQVAVKAKEYIRLNATRGLTVRGVVDALGISRRTLELRVKEATGSNVRSLIMGARMEKVCELLTTTELPIARVVEAAGCPNASSVFVQFKRRYGMPMTQYRKEFSQVGTTTLRKEGAL